MYSVDRQWRLELIHTLLLSWSIPLCPIHVVTFNLISNLVTDYIQKRRGEPGLFSLDLSQSITFWVYPHPFEKKGVDQTMTEAEHNWPIPKLFDNRPAASATEVFCETIGLVIYIQNIPIIVSFSLLLSWK